MKTSIGVITAALASALGATTALAQTSDDSLRMPYQKEFWTTGHAGVEVGRSKLDIGCPTGLTCDNRANAFKLFAGGRFNNVFGGEVSFLQTNSFDRTGPGTTGNVKLQAVNFGLLAGIPFGPVVGKLMGFPPNLGELIRTSNGVKIRFTDEKARRELGYTSRPFREGLEQTLAAEPASK